MTIFLPEEGHTLDEIDSKLTSGVLNTIFTTLNSGAEPELVKIALPKFKLEQQYELTAPLKQMGAPLPFDQNQADFTKIAKDTHISSVVHKAVVEVNEKGTEAAAAMATFITMELSIPRKIPCKHFICDRPFMFMIHEQNHGTILFIGKYVKPRA